MRYFLGWRGLSVCAPGNLSQTAPRILRNLDACLSQTPNLAIYAEGAEPAGPDIVLLG